MSYSIRHPRLVDRRFIAKRRAHVALLALALSSTNSWAAMDETRYGGPGVEVRGFRADAPPPYDSDCRPANGAQIRGNFAGPGDWLNVVTGDICYSDPRPQAP